MKVICIDGVKAGVTPFQGDVYDGIASKDDEVYEGVSYTVFAEKIIFGEPAYQLEERPIKHWYKKSRFIPRSDIDETELVNHKPQTIEQ